MKKIIRASKTADTIFEDKYFALVSQSGVGINNTPYTNLEVKSKDLASKHVVEIRLNTTQWEDFTGEPVRYTYKDCYIAHGMRSVTDTLDETAEYIEVLEDALNFADKVNAYLPQWNAESE